MRNLAGRSPLHLAAMNGIPKPQSRNPKIHCTDVSDFFVVCLYTVMCYCSSYDPNVWHFFFLMGGKSSLHASAEINTTPTAHLGVIELLITDAGADCRMRDREGRRPMDMTTLEEVRFRGEIGHDSSKEVRFRDMTTPKQLEGMHFCGNFGHNSSSSDICSIND